MSYTGTVRDGTVVLDESPNPLPNGTRVEILIARPQEGTSEPGNNLPPLSDRLKNFLSHTVDLPEDASFQHDHYLYGTPKK